MNKEVPMRPFHVTISSVSVHRLAHDLLARTLNWQPFRQSVGVGQLFDLLLLMAATTRTLFAVVSRHFPFSHETARRAVQANLTNLDTLTTGLVDALHGVLAFTRRDRHRRWTVAIDTHNRPYYGQRSTPHLVGGQKKQGTQYFFSYASAVLIHRRRRYTIGLMPLTQATPAHQIVEALLDQIQRRGLLVGGVVLDSGFDSGDTILTLQRRGLSYTIPLRRKGRGTNRRNACFAWPSGTLGDVSWVTDQTHQAVSTRVLVWQRAGQPRAKVYAFGGWGAKPAVAEARRAWLGRRRYRERFGIETSYRQKNQARAWTTSRSVAYRLLLEGLAHLLRQIWVWLTEQVARSQRATPTAWVAVRLHDLLELLADLLKARHRQDVPTIRLPNPLQQDVTR
jgi:hypothetical protein